MWSQQSRAALRGNTFKRKGDPHGRAGGCSPLLQLPLLVGVVGLSTSLKWSRVVGVVHMMLLPRVHLIGLVGILVGGCPCTTAASLQTARDTPCKSPVDLIASHLEACSTLDSNTFRPALLLNAPFSLHEASRVHLQDRRVSDSCGDIAKADPRCQVACWFCPILFEHAVTGCTARKSAMPTQAGKHSYTCGCYVLCCKTMRIGTQTKPADATVGYEVRT